MSRIGKKKISIPSGVQVQIDGQSLKVKGPKGELSLLVPFKILVKQEGEELNILRESEQSDIRALHGTYRALIFNMVHGVSQGFEKTLDLVGVGYRAQSKGKSFTISLGYSHPIEYFAPDGIQIEIPQENKIIVKGADKQKVGQVAAEIRSFRPPEPYKGKGVKLSKEVIIRKAGKSASK